MTLHSITPEVKDLRPCLYPREKRILAWCVTHCSSHQGINSPNGDTDQYDTGNCHGAQCIHDAHWAENPLRERDGCTNCGARTATWDAAYDPVSRHYICWSCMDEIPEYLELFRPTGART